MKTVIGLGTCGCAIADEFGKYPEYTILKLDSDIKTIKNTFCLQRYDTPEEYELNPPNLVKFFKKIKGEVLFVIGGSGEMSNYSLVVLEQLKDKDVSILFIQPDLNFLSYQGKLINRIVYNILQELTRSGVFKRMYLISNPVIEEMLGGLPVIGYNEKLNEMIVSTFHMYNIFENAKPVVSTVTELPVAARITTIGLVDLQTKDERLFFPLDRTTDVVYYFGYNEDELQSNKELLREIKNVIKNKKDGSNLRVSYGVFATNYNKSYGFCANHTSVIQS